MKGSLLIFGAVLVIAGAEAARPRHSTTSIPCPDVCPYNYDPVCAEDDRMIKRKFPNRCVMQMCQCRIWLREVPLEKCPEDAPGCPIQIQPPGPVSGLDSVDEHSSDSESDYGPESAEVRILRKNQLRKNHQH